MIRLDRLNTYSLFTAHGRRGVRTPVHTWGGALGLISLCSEQTPPITALVDILRETSPTELAVSLLSFAPPTLSPLPRLL
jgi:hypothetical protein